MDLTAENRKRNEFIQIITELAKNKEITRDKSARIAMYRRLEALYYSPEKEKRYRHFYSDIFSFLAHLPEDNESDLETLSINISIIREGYQPKNKDPQGNLIDISDSLKKLYDHLNLDMARIEYSKAESRKVAGPGTIEKVNVLEANVEQVSNIAAKLENANKKIIEDTGKLQESNKNMQKEYVAILGVFAAVLMAFFSGVGFSSSVLSNLDKASIYRLILGILLLGMVLFNMMGLLLNFIKEIVYKERVSKWWVIVGNIAFICLLVWLYAAWRLSWLGTCEVI